MSSAKTGFGAWFEQNQKTGGGGGGGGGAPDLEVGSTGASAVDGAGQLLSSFSTNIQSRLGIATSPTAPAEYTFGLTTSQRYQAFAILMMGSCALYSMSLFVFLPMLLFAPAKFASAFTFASLMWLAGMACVRGPRSTLNSMFSNQNATATAAYLGSMALTLYATMGAQSYLLVMAAVLLQVGAAAWYSASFVPGGSAGMGALLRWMCSPLGRRLWPFGR